MAQRGAGDTSIAWKDTPYNSQQDRKVESHHTLKTSCEAGDHHHNVSTYRTYVSRW